MNEISYILVGLVVQGAVILVAIRNVVTSAVRNQIHDAVSLENRLTRLETAVAVLQRSIQKD